MGIDIAGATIATSGTGIAFNSNFLLNGSGVGGLYTGRPGYCGYRSSDSNRYSTGSGWVPDTVLWNNGLNTSTGVFTCPVAGQYAMSFNGIVWGYGVDTSYSYFAWLKNNSIVYWGHVNLSSTNVWDNAGCVGIMNCAVNDTITLKINQSPTPVAANAVANNRGAYGSHHHCIWVMLIG